MDSQSQSSGPTRSFACRTTTTMITSPWDPDNPVDFREGAAQVECDDMLREQMLGILDYNDLLEGAVDHRHANNVSCGVESLGHTGASETEHLGTSQRVWWVRKTTACAGSTAGLLRADDSPTSSAT